MKTRSIIIPLTAAIAVAGCGQSANGEDSMPSGAAAAFEAISGEYNTDPRHRYITFSYFHFGNSRPWLRWRDWDATLDWNAENPDASTVEVVIDAESVDSGVDVFDGHLQGERFFDTANHPEITFVSTAVQRTGENTGVVSGDLTIKAITKPVALDVVFNKASYDGRSGYKLGFSGKTVLKRSEFGLDYLAPAVSDEVEILIEAEFVMPAKNSE